MSCMVFFKVTHFVYTTYQFIYFIHSPFYYQIVFIYMYKLHFNISLLEAIYVYESIVYVIYSLQAFNKIHT